MAGRGSNRKNMQQDKFQSIRDRKKIGGNNALKTGDARLKIIQKNRSKLVDARDKLAQMAKKTDARTKLLKLRQMRKSVSTLSTDIVQPVGSNILKKTDRNGKISLSTKKVTNNTDINTAIKKELGIIQRKKVVTSPKTRGLRNNGLSLAAMKRSPINEETPFRRNLVINKVSAYRAPPIIKRTIRNDIVRELPIHEMPSYGHIVDQNMYTWVRPESSSVSNIEPRRQNVKIMAKNNLQTVDLTTDWNYADPNVRSIKMSPYFIDDDVEMSPPRTTTIKTGVHARLDTPAPPSQSQGIFSQAKTKVVVPVGHRIVVSNLQATVTQDDIRELFEDVGELLVSRLVRPGTAEVIYKNLKDAQKAVDTYHNRQLDGQPMKCLLVNKRPINNPTAPAVRTAKTTTSVLRTNGGMVKKTITSNKNSNKLVPDISTIHKVLFHKT